MTTILRQRMTEDMQVRNLSPQTQSAYIMHVSLFARHFKKSPELLGPEEIRAYQVYLTNQRKLAVSSINLNPAVGVGRAADFCDFSTKSCCVSRARGVAASATDGPEGKLGRLSRGFAASVAGPSTAPHFLPARAKKWRQRETPSRPESPLRVNSLR